MKENFIDKSKSFIRKFEIQPISKGVLDGLKFSVKDVIDVQGYKTSFGNKEWENTHPIADHHADCVKLLLNAGASCIGKTVLGEFCCGVEGKNHFYGMPLNPINTDLTPGGSSSGAASSVGFGLVDFALGTDMAGSVRIPASFCGVYGFRPTHGCISLQGCMSLSSSLDTLGLLSSSLQILKKSLVVLFDKFASVEKYKNLIVLDKDLLSLCDPEVVSVYKEFYLNLSKTFGLNIVYFNFESFNDVDMTLPGALKIILCSEIYESLKGWLDEKNITYGVNTYVDFNAMKNSEPFLLKKAYQYKTLYAKKLKHLLHGNILCLPTVPMLPRKLAEIQEKKVNQFDYDRLRPFISLSSMGGLPELTIPIKHDGFSIGISLLGESGSDLSLLNFAEKINK